MLLSEHCWFLLTSTMEEIAPLTGSRCPSPPGHSSPAGRTLCTPSCQAQSGPWGLGSHLQHHCPKGILAPGPKALSCELKELDAWDGEWARGIIRAVLAESAKGCETQHALSWLSLQWTSLQWSRLFPTLRVQFQRFGFLCLKSLISETSWLFPCNLAFTYMHGHTQAHVVPALLLLHESHMRMTQVF